jgi:hypothetical protein
VCGFAQAGVPLPPLSAQLDSANEALGPARGKEFGLRLQGGTFLGKRHGVCKF